MAAPWRSSTAIVERYSRVNWPRPTIQVVKTPRITPSGKRSLPEHTVDCWVSAAVAADYPDALLWAPTQRGYDNWDIAFGHSPGKAFILENKGTSSGLYDHDEHIVQIDVGQLSGYLAMPGAPVYYVLPVPPWPASESTAPLHATAAVPSTARCRTGISCTTHQPHGPFTEWCYVLEAMDLAKLLGFTKTQKRNILASSIAAAPCAVRLIDFLRGIGDCTHGGRLYGSFDEAYVDWTVVHEGRRADAADLVGGFRRHAGRGMSSGVLAVFVPIAGSSKTRGSRGTIRRRPSRGREAD